MRADGLRGHPHQAERTVRAIRAIGAIETARARANVAAAVDLTRVEHGVLIVVDAHVDAHAACHAVRARGFADRAHQATQAVHATIQPVGAVAHVVGGLHFGVAERAVEIGVRAGVDAEATVQTVRTRRLEARANERRATVANVSRIADLVRVQNLVAVDVDATRDRRTARSAMAARRFDARRDQR